MVRFGKNGDGLGIGGQRSGPSSTGTAEVGGAGEDVADHGGQQYANGDQASDGSGVVGVHWLSGKDVRIVTECKGGSQDLIRAAWPMAWAPKCLVISACMCHALSRDMAKPRSSSISVQP